MDGRAPFEDEDEWFPLTPAPLHCW